MLAPSGRCVTREASVSYTNIVQVIIAPIIGVVIAVLLCHFGKRKIEQPRCHNNIRMISRRDNIFWMFYISLFAPILLESVSIFLIIVLNLSYKKPLDCLIIATLLSLPILLSVLITSHARFANVGIVDNGLLVSRFTRKIIVSFEEIEAVKSADSLRENTYRLVINFKNKSTFGGSIDFFAVNEQIEGELLSLLKKSS